MSNGVARSARNGRLGECLVAVPANKCLVKRFAAGLVHEHGGRLIVVDPLVAPAHQRNQGRRQSSAHRGEPVLVTRRAFAVQTAFKYTGHDQPFQTFGEDRTSDVEVTAEIIEPSDSTKRVAHDQNGPTVTEYVEARLNRARSIGVVLGVCHCPTISEFGIRTKSVRFPNPLRLVGQERNAKADIGTNAVGPRERRPTEPVADGIDRRVEFGCLHALEWQRHLD